ncbi:MAG: DUF5666 domain-containing protein [Gammaproteobacteria bacterium]
MKTLFYKTALSAAIAASLISCGGAGSGVAGIGGSGFVATGAITGFGSVFVNGIEFETSSSTFDVDGSSGTQSDLAVGMIVNVSGSINSDGVTGNATSISFDDQLQGPVASVSLADDNDNRTLTILGTTVRINAVSTLFDVSGALPPTVFNFDNIAAGNSVEISGFFNDSGVLIATRVELKATAFSPSNIVELKGTISGLANTTFTVNGVNVDASSAQLDDLPNGLVDGAFVEVKGTCSDASCSTLSATRVEGEDNSIDDSNKVSIEGIITDFVNNSSFKIGGVSVDASSATFSPATLVLRDNLLIEVEGPVVGGVLQATSVEIRGSNAKVHAKVSAITADGIEVAFTGTGNTTQTIAVTITSDTEVKDPFAMNDFVKIQGFENESGGVTATELEVKSSDDDVIVQGNMTVFIADTSVTVLGVTFDIDYNGDTGETDYEDDADAHLTEPQFVSAAPLGSLIKIKDDKNNLNGTADEIDIELD